MLTEQQKTAANAYGDSLYQHQIEHQQEYNPERLAKVPQADLDAYRQRMHDDGEKLALEILSTDTLMPHVAVCRFHPSNAASRRLFTALTGVSLPATVGGTREAIAAFVGPAYDAYYADQEAERTEKETAKREQKQRKEQERIDAIIADIQSGEAIDGEELVDVAKHIGVSVHPRTIGTLRKRVYSITAQQARFRGRNRLPNTVFEVFRAVAAKLETATA
jgi:ribosomal protein L12E/L44/L45/RPP1/RPP2